MQPILPITELGIKVLANAGILPVNREELPVTTSAHGRFRYPLKKMIVGDSFFVPANGRNVIQLQNSLTTSVQNIQRKRGWKFTQKRCGNGIRVWRLQ